MKFKHQGKEYDMPVRKFKDQKSYSSALDLAKARSAKAKAKKEPETKEEHNKQQSRIADQFSR